MKLSRYPRKLKKKIKKENRALCSEYPFLLPRNVWSGNIIDNFNYTYNEFEASMPRGWYKRFGKALMEDLKEVLLKNNALDSYMIFQMKEKYGGLRLYSNFEAGDWRNHMYAWEYISEHTCINCGKFPAPMRYNGWISPECENCMLESAKKYNKRVNKKELSAEEIEKIRKEAKKDEKFNNRLLETLCIRIYDKDGEHEEYVDMKPYYDKIGWEYTEDDLISLEEYQKLKEQEESEENA